MDLETYQALGLNRSLSDVDPTRVVNSRANREIQQALSTPGDRQYHPCPEAFPATTFRAARSSPTPAGRGRRCFPRPSATSGSTRRRGSIRPGPRPG